ncbi:UDP-N-acetylmuramoylalanyl-D-glutamate--2,6-diaminopimelate ligase [Desulfobotulus alkaliphilus]|uniref:UDP-N-acetylmuramoyl-L-alanyl-D-glutamate--2,6-diaminopimelate ligase n=1 Tax=Desulfobotulus alkaliphilus TaxID=622671 RepID=A0A562RGX1_9BACT|nr:UDP-N-acetylmuramoyl-L-alanyl-D-glutamate--2,6-diaminopimelate ligase [Desulfobotulus alkaliphilus]TWI68093.1 UDP-N-acetylmuramoylalanyl-D-glutamate--2,6-diaminopimelate ligase [Desulfobotulus alkaliphilus]
MKVSDLFSPWDKFGNSPFILRERSPENPDIRGIHYNSEKIQPGDLFVAVPGFAADGHCFARQAAEKGAVFLVAERPVPEAGLPTAIVSDSRKALAALSAAFYGFPAKDLTLIGITGTNGKSTTAHILEQILIHAGHATGVMGTIDWHYPGHRETVSTTTPESRDLQARLAAMGDAGVTHVIMEVSSHAIDLGRIAHTPFDVAVFTNLSQDHLDYHGNIENYWNCKKGFLEGTLNGRYGKKGACLVLNIDDPRGEKLLNECIARTGGHRLLSTGQHPDALIRPGDPRFSLSGIRCSIATPEETIPVHCPLVGAFNLENILGAAAAALALQVPPETIKKALESPLRVPGRLEPVSDPRERFIFVDYAHTPDALKKALSALKKSTHGRLIVVFGCGGDRDRTKRPLMAGIAAANADFCVITSDNPRSENPEAIIQDILQGIPEGTPFLVEKDREKAILAAIAMAGPGDTLLIAGKGHENYQIVGNKILSFDDRAIAQKGVLSHA